MNTTQIYIDYASFANRINKNENGVSRDFANDNPDFKNQNGSNVGCWNCEKCLNCEKCSNCENCSNCLYCNCLNYCQRCAHCLDCAYCSECFNCQSRYELNYCK